MACLRSRASWLVALRVPSDGREGIDMDAEFVQVVVDDQPRVCSEPVNELLTGLNAAAQPPQDAGVYQPYYFD